MKTSGINIPLLYKAFTQKMCFAIHLLAVYFILNLLSASNSYAQITLTSASFPTTIVGYDSLKQTIATSSLPILTPTIDGVWDMSVVIDSTPNIIVRHAPDATHQFADSDFYSLGGYTYLGYLQSGVTSVGMQQFGVLIPKKIFDLYPATGGSHDSLYIDSQNVTFNIPVTKLSFPTGFGSSWQTISYSDMFFHTTYQAYPMMYSAGKLRKYINEIDTVIGWGKMRVLDENGLASSFFDVLQIQSTTIVTDSVLMDTPLYNGVVLGIMHLLQGQQKTTFQQYFYRAGTIIPLAKINFTDANFTSPINAITHVQVNMNLVPEVKMNTKGIKIYPNPVYYPAFTIELPNIGMWNFELISIDGKVIKNEAVFIKNLHWQYVLPKEITDGVYFLKCIDNNNSIYQNQIEVIR